MTVYNLALPLSGKEFCSRDRITFRHSRGIRFVKMDFSGALLSSRTENASEAKSRSHEYTYYQIGKLIKLKCYG